MSLWKVDDVATAELMSVFYKLRDGKNNLQAFREKRKYNCAKIIPSHFTGALL